MDRKLEDAINKSLQGANYPKSEVRLNNEKVRELKGYKNQVNGYMEI